MYKRQGLKEYFSRLATERSFYVSYRGVALSIRLTRTSCPSRIAMFPAPDLLEDFPQQMPFIDIRGCGFPSILDPTLPFTGLQAVPLETPHSADTVSQDSLVPTIYKLSKSSSARREVTATSIYRLVSAPDLR